MHFIQTACKMKVHNLLWRIASTSFLSTVFTSTSRLNLVFAVTDSSLQCTFGPSLSVRPNVPSANESGLPLSLHWSPIVFDVMPYVPTREEKTLPTNLVKWLAQILLSLIHYYEGTYLVQTCRVIDSLRTILWSVSVCGYFLNTLNRNMNELELAH